MASSTNVMPASAHRYAIDEWPALSRRSLYSSQAWTSIGEQHADVLPARPAGGEVVLDDPLPERLGDDRPTVVDPAARRPARPGRLPTSSA